MESNETNTLAVWREAGEWWSSEPYHEVRRFLDEKGIRRESITELPSLGLALGGQCIQPYQEDHREEISLRIRKVRDEKVAKACGYAPESRGAIDRISKVAETRTPEQRRDKWGYRFKSSVFADTVQVVSTKASAKYVALHTLSGYAFGRSSMLAEEIPAFAAGGGLAGALIADPFSLVGAAEFTGIAQKVGIKPLIGTSFEMPEGGEIVLVARTQIGFRSLSRLITECHLDEPRLFPLCTWERLAKHTQDLLCLTGGSGGLIDRLLIRGDTEAARGILKRLIKLYRRENVFVQIERSYLPWEHEVGNRLLQLAEVESVIPVAGGPITHARPEHFPAQDILACVDTLCTVDEVVGRKPQRDASQPQVKQLPRRGMNAERYLRSAEEMSDLFVDRPDLVANTLRVAERCESYVLPERTKLPRLFLDDAATLREITLTGAATYHRTLSRPLMKRIDHELDRIIRLGYETHFLVAWEMCEWAREQQIVLSGRGSVVDSAVAYCLGFSRIDAFEHDLHFDRFLPSDGSKRPDIDIDFEAKRRDDIRNHLADKYGKDNVATVAAVGAYCSRGIVREVGKAMGLPDDCIGYLAKRLHGGVTPDRLEAALEGRPELRDSGIPKERFRWVFRLAERLMDVPRNIRSHSSGVIISSEPIADTLPVMYSGVESVRIIQWDKRSAKKCFDKFDVLCLRGQDVLSNAQQKIRARDIDFNVERLPIDDPETYRAIRSGNLIGIPQSASPAMRQAHIRLQTMDLTDASLVQAGIRPGVGGAVKINELIARRRGKPFGYEHPLLEKVLKNTYGLIVFQEQVDQLLQEFGGYSCGEAENTREAIHKRRREEFVKTLKEDIVQRIMSNGFERNVAEVVYELVAGFQGYGFAQGHALAFAEISVRSVYCQQNYPAEYFAAILNAQPAGYYGPSTLANEARIRGVKVLPPCVNQSGMEFEVEDVKAAADPKIILPHAGIRTALRQISNVSEETLEKTYLGKPFESFFDYAARVRPARDELERMILCGAFDALHPNRRALLWSIPSAVAYSASFLGMENALPLHTPEPSLVEEVIDFSDAEKSVYERRILGMDVEHHLMEYERERVLAKGGVTSAQASCLAPTTKAFVVGNPIRLRFPPTASGKRVVFFDLEDETGLLNVTCFDDTYQKDGHAIVCSPYVTIKGIAQDRDGHIAFLAHRVFQYHPTLSGKLSSQEPLPIKVGDYLVG